MSNRMEIELTSARDDGTFTWRAAGARQPKGVVEAELAGPAAKVGDVLRVEAEIEIDGITILTVLPPKEKKGAAPDRIELLAPSKPAPGVTTVLVSEGGRGPRDRGDLLDSRSRSGRPGGRGRGREGDRGAPGRQGDRPPAGRTPPRDGTPTPAGTERRPERRPRREPAGEGATAAGRPAGAAARDGAKRPPRGPGRETTARRAPARFEPGTKHRDELLATLPPEQRPVADRLASGGLPAVRKALAEERSRAKAEGRPEMNGDAILALAEQLQPGVKQAMWLDRAEAASAQLDKIGLRDLRTTVVAAAPRDDDGRELARRLREELDRRVTKLRTTWEEQMQHALEEGRVLQALRLSAQPPEPTARFPATLVESLAAKVGAAMTTSTPPERWLAMLAAAVASPIRRQIHPEGLAEDPSGEVLRQARLAAGSVPALAPLLGLTMPPPPKPLPRPARPPRPPRPTRAPRAPQTAMPATGDTSAATAGVAAGSVGDVTASSTESPAPESAAEAPVPAAIEPEPVAATTEPEPVASTTEPEPEPEVATGSLDEQPPASPAGDAPLEAGEPADAPAETTGQATVATQRHEAPAEPDPAAPLSDA